MTIRQSLSVIVWSFLGASPIPGQEVYVQGTGIGQGVSRTRGNDCFVITAAHDRDTHYLKNALLLALNSREDVEVLNDVRIDWQVEGIKPHGPDLVVFVDVRKPWKRDVGTFRVKDVGARPVLVIEVTSPNTRSGDIDQKVLEYYQAGVPFYAIVDYYPELEERQVHIIGYRATPEGYARVPLDEKGRLWLEPVRLWLGGEGDRHGQSAA